MMRARGFERGDEMPLRRRIERVAQRPRRAQQPLREKCGVHQRLPLAREVEEVGRRRIDGAADRAPGEIRILRPQPPFRRVVGGKLDPRRDARDQPAERFEMRHRLALGAGRLLDRHARLERAVGQIRQDRIREPPHDGDPDVAVPLRSGPSLFGTRGRSRQHRERATRTCSLEEFTSIHKIKILEFKSSNVRKFESSTVQKFESSKVRQFDGRISEL